MIWRTDEIASDWPLEPLACIATKVGSGATPRGGRATYPAKGTPFIRSQNVRFDGFTPVGLAFPSDSQAADLSGATVDANDVLLNITGASIGRVCLAPAEVDGARVNQHVCIIRTERVHPMFLSLYLASPQVQDAIAHGNYGATRQALTKAQLLELPVPVPAPAARKEIAERVAAIEARRASALEHLAAARVRVGRFSIGALASACAGHLTTAFREQAGRPPELAPIRRKRPRGFRALDTFEVEDLAPEWSWAQVDDLLPAGGIFDGPFGTNLRRATTHMGARVIRLENIGHLTFLETKETYVSRRSISRSAATPCTRSDIVFSSFVSEQIRVCVLPPDLDDHTLAKADCFTLRPVDKINREYLAMQLASPRTFRFLAGDIRGATRPRVNTTQVRSLPVRCARRRSNTRSCDAAVG